LPFAREALQWLAFQHRFVALNIVEYLRFHHKKPAVNPAFAELRLLRELRNQVTRELEAAKPRWWPDCGECCEFAMRAVILHELPYIQPRYPVSVGQHER